MKFYSNQEINKIANEVVRYLPSLTAFYNCEEYLNDYSKRINHYIPSAVHLERQKIFKKLLKEKIDRIFNQEELQKININIDDDWGVVGGVVDHHGILDHPLLLSVTLVSNFYKLFKKDKEGDILTFATGNVPLNEPFRKRGIMLNGKKINIFKKADQHKIVYGQDKLDIDILYLINKNKLWKNFLKKEVVFLKEMDKIIKDIDYSTCKNLGEQFTKINFHIWPLLFKDKLRGNVANLVSVENDDLIVEYLIYIIQNEKESFIYKMLFNEGFQKIVLDEFRGLTGAWDSGGEIGTHFFWGIDENHKRIHLKIENGFLINKKSNYKLPFAAEHVISELKQQNLLPGILLKFSIFIFYMGAKPLMGYSLEYLTRMKKKMINILENDFLEEAELIKQVPLDNMNLISICKEKDSSNKLKDLHAFDVFYREGLTKDYFDKINLLQFKEYMIPALLFAYDYGFDKYGSKKNEKNKIKFSITEDELQKSFYKLF